jgi:hypothetical protein
MIPFPLLGAHLLEKCIGLQMGTENRGDGEGGGDLGVGGEFGDIEG